LSSTLFKGLFPFSNIERSLCQANVNEHNCIITQHPPLLQCLCFFGMPCGDGRRNPSII
jgi:hypothetical protein